MNVWRKRGARRRPHSERGSALLIVFVFAAMIAIMLYAEMPVAVFEAKRQKEQLLIDRGNEYAHAVKLFVRKFGMYPATIEQLESTNRMRFLRHRFKDPFTGKENWRMLHAGPGGQLIDSKVKPAGLTGLTPNANASSAFGSNTGTGFGSTSSGTSFGSTTQSSSSGFGTSSLGSFGSDKSADAVVVPDLPQRPPAIPANGAPSSGSGSGETGSAPAEAEQSGTSSVATDDLRQQMAVVEQAQASSLPAEIPGQSTGGQPGAAGTGQAEQNVENNPATQAAAPGATDTQNATATVRNMLGSGNPAIGAPLAGSGGAGTGTGMGQLSGGGIAGVASVAHGHSIKTVNDQTDYSLWEFYYDPTKDATRNMPGFANGLQGNGQPGVGQNGASPGGANGNSIFQQSTSSQSSFGQSSFGSSNSGQSGASSSPGASAQPSNPPQ